MTDQFNEGAYWAICWTYEGRHKGHITSIVNMYRNGAIRDFLKHFIDNYDRKGRITEALDAQERKKWDELKKRGTCCKRVYVRVAE